MEINTIPDKNEILSGMILSASGWRGVFAANSGDESFGSEISAGRRIFCAAAAMAFSGYLKKLNKKGDIIMGRDTRPTGAAIA
ncbi:MAG: phosphatidylglycerol lysyltransferase, partial [Treponema sp.]|nr:phosphatidylglycerol lysyltransferase [Treponema sp.]